MKTNPLKEAIEIKKLQGKGLTQFEIAGRLRISQPSISQKLSLLDLIPELRKALEEKKIPLINAYDLARKPATEQQGWYSSFITTHMKACPHCGYLMEKDFVD